MQTGPGPGLPDTEILLAYRRSVGALLCVFGQQPWKGTFSLGRKFIALRQSQFGLARLHHASVSLFLIILMTDAANCSGCVIFSGQCNRLQATCLSSARQMPRTVQNSGFGYGQCSELEFATSQSTQPAPRAQRLVDCA